MESDCEILWVELLRKGKNMKSMFLGVFYRPPSSSVEIMNEFGKSLFLVSQFNKTRREIILAGDFNLPSVKWNDGYVVKSDNSEITRTVLDTIDNNFLYQHVSEPTRITDTTSNILDLIFTTDPSHMRSINVVPGVSDHEAIVFLYDLKIHRNVIKRKVYFYSKGNYEQLRKDLNNASLCN